MYTDGSYTPGRGDEDEKLCGWGFTVIPVEGGSSLEMCGPVDLPQSAPFAAVQVAQRLSNNVGELCAILHGLYWVSQNRQIRQLTIAYESDSASNMIRRIWHPRTNISLILACREALAAVECFATVEWHKVESHTGDFHNERADKLAACGAAGRRLYTHQVMGLAIHAPSP